MTERAGVQDHQMIDARRLSVTLKDNIEGFKERKKKLVDQTKEDLSERAQELDGLGLFPTVVIAKESFIPSKTALHFDAIDLGFDPQSNANILLNKNGRLQFAKLIHSALNGVTIESTTDRYSPLLEYPEDEHYEKYVEKAFGAMQRIIDDALPHPASPQA